MPPWGMLLDVNFSERLLTALRVSGKTRTELARHLGVTPSTVTQAINGQTLVLSAANTTRAADLCRVEALWLATGEGPMQRAALSPMALDIAKRFDQVRIDERDRLYALLLYQLQLASARPPAEQPQPPAATDELPPRR